MLLDIMNNDYYPKANEKAKPNSIEELMKQMNELENKHKQEMKVLEDQYKEIKSKGLKKEVNRFEKFDNKDNDPFADVQDKEITKGKYAISFKLEYSINSTYKGRKYSYGKEELITSEVTIDKKKSLKQIIQEKIAAFEKNNDQQLMF